MTDTIKLELGWKQAMPILIACLENGTAKGREDARKHLMTLAETLDHRTHPPELTEDDREGLIDAARTAYATNDEIMVDSDAGFSVADGGVWVQGWLWVPHEDDEDSEDSEGSGHD